MATETLCDCCGHKSCDACPEPEFERCGLVICRDYCQHARAIYERFAAERDALHDELFAAWREREAELRTRYREQLGALPDE